MKYSEQFLGLAAKPKDEQPSSGSDPFAFDPEKENDAGHVRVTQRLPFRNKRTSDYHLMQPVIKIPRLSGSFATYRAADAVSPDVEILAPDVSDRDSPFTPTPEPGAFPPSAPSFSCPKATRATTQSSGSAQPQGTQGPKLSQNVRDVEGQGRFSDPAVESAAEDLCRVVHMDSRCSSARDSAVGDLSPPRAVSNSVSDSMSDALTALYEGSEFCIYLSFLVSFFRRVVSGFVFLFFLSKKGKKRKRYGQECALRNT